MSPARLRSQLADLTSVFTDPARLQRRCLELLGFYTHRLRPTGRSGGPGSPGALSVPLPVLREVERALVEAGAGDLHAAALAAEGLWATARVEARWLAIGLLQVRPLEELPEWVGAWSESADDPRLLEKLASGPLARMAAADPGLFWSTLQAILGSRSSWATTLAWLALKEVVAELDAGDLPRVFETLSAAPESDSGDVWRAEVEVLQAAARRSPAETARFLLDAIDGGRPGAVRLARHLLRGFPDREQAALRRSLRRVDLG